MPHWLRALIDQERPTDATMLSARSRLQGHSKLAKAQLHLRVIALSWWVSQMSMTRWVFNMFSALTLMVRELHETPLPPSHSLCVLPGGTGQYDAGAKG